MAVVKPRENRFAFRIQDTRVWTYKAPHLGILAHEHDVFTTDRQGLGSGKMGIHSQDVPVLDNEVCRAGLDAIAAHAEQNKTVEIKAKA